MSDVVAEAKALLDAIGDAEFWDVTAELPSPAILRDLVAEVERLREEQAAMQRALTQTAREIRSLEKRIVERDAKVVMAAMRELGG
jgi:hypothetical protein